jgi:hypothetical protein
MKLSFINIIKALSLSAAVVLLSTVFPCHNAYAYGYDRIRMEKSEQNDDTLTNLQKPDQELNNSLKKEEKEAKKNERKALKQAQKSEKIKNRPAPIPNPNHADYIILGKDLPVGRSLLEAISGRVPGMMIQDNKVVTHGPSTFGPRPDPLFLVDGIEAQLEFANSISASEIERIEIFTSGAAAMWGTRASNGVISIIRKGTQR